MVHIKKHPWRGKGNCVWIDDRHLMYQCHGGINVNPKILKNGTCEMDIVVFHHHEYYKNCENVDEIPNQIKPYEILRTTKHSSTYRLFLKLDA